MTSREVLVRIIDGELSGDKARVIAWVEQALDLGYAFLTSVMERRNPALQIVGEGFNKQEIVLPRHFLAAEAA